MIRIRLFPNKISLLLFFLGIPVAGFGQLNMGARGLALGQATTALPDYSWSLFSNPALLNSDAVEAGFYGLRNYGFVEITDMSAMGSYPTKYGVTALGFHRYGDNLFNETRIRLGYKNDWQNLHFGAVINYNHISFGGDYSAISAVGLDLGIAAHVTEELWIGARATHVNQPSYGDGEDLPRELAVGFSYSLADAALFTMDVVKDVRFPVSYRGGLEVKVIKEVIGRVGVTTEPVTYSFGLGYGKDKWEVNLAVQNHVDLGLSPGFDLLFSF